MVSPVQLVGRVLPPAQPLTPKSSAADTTSTVIQRRVQDRFNYLLLLLQIGNRVIPPRVQGMAAGNPLDGQPATAPDSVAGDGLIAVLGTGRLKPAGGREYARESHLIEANHAQN